MLFKQSTIDLFAKLALISFLFFIQTTMVSAKQTHQLKQQLVVKSSSVIWGMDWLPNGDMLYTLLHGELKLLQKGQGISQAISGLPSIAYGGQGGLLDIAIHPEYEKNGWIYLTYSKQDSEENKSIAVIRGKLKGAQFVEQEAIYTAEAYDDGGRHFGSRLAFDHKGYLYFSIGDRGNRNSNPQDITRDAGKIYRLHDDGRIPNDNPFIKQKNAKTAIYSFGHRNPQGLTVHPDTGDLWSHEHGPRGGDEINLIKKGANYGWPLVSFGVNYSGFSFTDLTEKAGMESPRWDWTPSIAPSGMAFINSNRYPNWKGKLAAGSLKFGQLLILTVENQNVVAQQIAKDDLSRVRNVKQGPGGYLYIALDGQGIFKMTLSNE